MNYLKLLRVSNLFMMVLMQILILIFALPNHADRFSFIYCYLPILSVVLVAGAGYVINDYYDQKIDAINKPEKRIIGVKISEQNSVIFYVVLCFLTIGVSVFDLRFLILNVCFGFLLWIYAKFLKQKPFIGNFVVAFCTASSVWIMNLPHTQIYPKIIFFSVFAFITNLIREIIKDLEDQKGDKEANCKTLPIILGAKKTKFIVLFLVILLGVTLFLSSVLFSFEKFVIYVIFTELALIWSLRCLYQAQNYSDYRQLSWFYKILMLSGVLSVVLF